MKKALAALFFALSSTSVSIARQGAAPLPQGTEAPDFELAGLDGESHRLADHRGSIVVLEWTSHVCPAVGRVQDSFTLRDTRVALGERVVWLQVDSSWFAPALTEDIHAWRRRLALDVPYLLDPDGEVARSFGAVATPQLFVVDEDGYLAYSGALDDGAAEAERRNHVLEVVAALEAGAELPDSGSPPQGCTVKLGTPREAVATDVSDEAKAVALYDEACRLAKEGETEDALATLERAAGDRLRRWRIVADDAFRPLLEAAEPRQRLRTLLEARPARGTLTMVMPSEPGPGLVLSGTVRTPSGDPIPGAVISLYHTDSAGYYSPGSTSGQNSRLFGSVATDAQGRYRIRTVIPAHYAGTENRVPQHIHMSTRADGFQTNGGHPASIYFETDRALQGPSGEEIRSDGCVILPFGENAEGVALCLHDITLEPE